MSTDNHPGGGAKGVVTWGGWQLSLVSGYLLAPSGLHGRQPLSRLAN